jgi:hypothetical protein
MAERAGSRNMVVVDGASHVVMVCDPQAVADETKLAAEQAQP